MDFNEGLKDKAALVSGAASGIGLASASALAAAGVQVLMADINEEALLAASAELEKAGARVVARCLDVSDPSACKAAVAEALEQFGRLDILCNIAGFARPSHFADISVEDWQAMLDVNLSGVFYLCHAAMPELLKTKGCIVNMASSAGLVGQAYNVSYCATKGGVVMLTKALAVEFAKRGVRVNAICPGAVATPLAAKFVMPDNADMDVFARLFPLMEMARPEEVAAAVLYLVSPLSRFVTGEALAIDGGQTAS